MNIVNVFSLGSGNIQENKKLLNGNISWRNVCFEENVQKIISLGFEPGTSNEWLSEVNYFFIKFGCRFKIHLIYDFFM